MQVADLQLTIHQAIDAIDDTKKLEAIIMFLKDSKNRFRRKTVDEYIDDINEAREQVKNGEYLDIDQLENDSNKW